MPASAPELPQGLPLALAAAVVVLAVAMLLAGGGSRLPPRVSIAIGALTGLVMPAAPIRCPPLNLWSCRY